MAVYIAERAVLRRRPAGTAAATRPRLLTRVSWTRATPPRVRNRCLHTIVLCDVWWHGVTHERACAPLALLT